MPGPCQDPPLERCRGDHLVRVSENGTRKAQERAAGQNKPKTRSAPRVPLCTSRAARPSPGAHLRHRSSLVVRAEPKHRERPGLLHRLARGVLPAARLECRVKRIVALQGLTQQRALGWCPTWLRCQGTGRFNHGGIQTSREVVRAIYSLENVGKCVIEIDTAACKTPTAEHDGEHMAPDTLVILIWISSERQGWAFGSW